MKKIVSLSVIGLCFLSPYTKVTSSPVCVEQANYCDLDLVPSDIGYYLVGLGYTLYGTPVQNGNNWTVHTSYGSAHYTTTVFTNGTSITGHEDIGI